MLNEKIIYRQKPLHANVYEKHNRVLSDLENINENFSTVPNKFNLRFNNSDSSIYTKKALKYLDNSISTPSNTQIMFVDVLCDLNKRNLSKEQYLSQQTNFTSDNYAQNSRYNVDTSAYESTNVNTLSNFYCEQNTRKFYSDYSSGQNIYFSQNLHDRYLYNNTKNNNRYACNQPQRPHFTDYNNNFSTVLCDRNTRKYNICCNYPKTDCSCSFFDQNERCLINGYSSSASDKKNNVPRSYLDRNECCLTNGCASIANDHKSKFFRSFFDRNERCLINDCGSIASDQKDSYPKTFTDHNARVLTTRCTNNSNDLTQKYYSTPSNDLYERYNANYFCSPPKSIYSKDRHGLHNANYLLSNRVNQIKENGTYFKNKIDNLPKPSKTREAQAVDMFSCYNKKTRGKYDLRQLDRFDRINMQKFSHNKKSYNNKLKYTQHTSEDIESPLSGSSVLYSTHVKENKFSLNNVKNDITNFYNFEISNYNNLLTNPLLQNIRTNEAISLYNLTMKNNTESCETVLNNFLSDSNCSLIIFTAIICKLVDSKFAVESLKLFKKSFLYFSTKSLLLGYLFLMKYSIKNRFEKIKDLADLYLVCCIVASKSLFDEHLSNYNMKSSHLSIYEINYLEGLLVQSLMYNLIVDSCDIKSAVSDIQNIYLIKLLQDLSK